MHILLETRDMLHKDEAQLYKHLRLSEAKTQELIVEAEQQKQQTNCQKQKEIQKMKANIEMLQANLCTFQESFKEIVLESQKIDQSPEVSVQNQCRSSLLSPALKPQNNNSDSKKLS